MVKIYLDAGHGGTDSGAVGNGIYEKNVNLEVAKRIEKVLKENYENVEVMQTRTTDVFLSLAERTKRANAWKADAFVAIHVNSGPASARGFESHIYTQVGDDTKAFQNVMHEQIIGQIKGITGIVDRGKKQSNFHVLRESNMIAILTENLFISNSADAALLKSTSFLDKLVRGHVLGLEKFFGLAKNIPPPSEPKTPVIADELYQVIAGTFSDRDNADAMVKKLEADGYKAYVAKKE